MCPTRRQRMGELWKPDKQETCMCADWTRVHTIKRWRNAWWHSNRTTTTDIWRRSSRTSMTSSAVWSWPATTALTIAEILTKWSAATTTATTASTCSCRQRHNLRCRMPLPDTCNCRVTWVESRATTHTRTPMNLNTCTPLCNDNRRRQKLDESRRHYG